MAKFKDLFGREIEVADERALTPRERRSISRRTTVKARGYYAPPGTGPIGEKCGSCAWRCHVSGGSRSYWKCLLAEFRWSHGAATDIRLKSPACVKWMSEADMAKIERRAAEMIAQRSALNKLAIPFAPDLREPGDGEAFLLMRRAGHAKQLDVCKIPHLAGELPEARRRGVDEHTMWLVYEITPIGLAWAAKWESDQAKAKAEEALRAEAEQDKKDK